MLASGLRCTFGQIQKRRRRGDSDQVEGSPESAFCVNESSPPEPCAAVEMQLWVSTVTPLVVMLYLVQAWMLENRASLGHGAPPKDRLGQLGIFVNAIGQ